MVLKEIDKYQQVMDGVASLGCESAYIYGAILQEDSGDVWTKGMSIRLEVVGQR